MLNNRKLITIALMLLAFTACKKQGCTNKNASNYNKNATIDNGSCEFTTDNPAVSKREIDGVMYNVIPSEIISNLSLSNKYNWLLSDKSVVKNGSTLTIEPGTIIKTIAENENIPALIIETGALINASGTAEKPIIITPLTDTPLPGMWAGIHLNGKAKTNYSPPVIDAIPEFGGNNQADNSGVLSYVRVEYAGMELSTDNRSNGFSFNACGSKTQINHIQAYKCKDDGIEITGGTVSLKHILATGCGDDGIDWNFGWQGNGQFWIVEQNNEDGDKGIEADNNSHSNLASPFSNPNISNVTLIGADDGDNSNIGFKIRSGCKGNFTNFIITGFPKRGCQISHNETLTNMENGDLKFSHSIIDNEKPLKFTNSEGDEYTGPVTFETGFSNTIASDGSLVSFLSGYNGVSNSNPKDPTSLGIWFEKALFIGALDPENDWTINWTKKL